jgi:hypothetical protein
MVVPSQLIYKGLVPENELGFWDLHPLSGIGTLRHFTPPLELVAVGVQRTWLDLALAYTDRE